MGNNEKDYILENLSLLISSGMGISEALDVIDSELRGKTAKAAVTSLKEDIEGGSSLWRALEKTKLYPDRVVSLIRIGEHSGQLVENLSVVVEQQRKDRVFRSKIQSAMFYPVFVLVVAFVVSTGIAWFILPRFVTVFSSLRVELPLLTRVLIAVGDFLRLYGALAIPILVILICALVFFVFFFKRTRFVGQRILLALPAVNKLVRDVEIARFGYILGTLFEAGIPVVESLESLEQSTTLHDYEKFYSYLKESIEEGNTFKKSFAFYPGANKFLPGPVRHIIISAEKSGGLPQALLQIGRTYEESTETTAKNLSVILEPLLLFAVWFVVVAVALAVVLPIYSLIGGFNF